MPLTDVDMTRDQQIRALQKMVDENLGARGLYFCESGTSVP